MTYVIKWTQDYIEFIFRCFVQNFKGSWKFYTWMTFLSILSLIGLNAYCKQLVEGLAITGMTDQVSWGVYIANFTFKLFWWQVVLLVVGLASWWTLKKRSTEQKLYTYLLLFMTAYLIFYYGAWKRRLCICRS